jgi:uncharacterized protein
MFLTVRVEENTLSQLRRSSKELRLTYDEPERDIREFGCHSIEQLPDAIGAEEVRAPEQTNTPPLPAASSRQTWESSETELDPEIMQAEVRNHTGAESHLLGGALDRLTSSLLRVWCIAIAFVSSLSPVSLGLVYLTLVAVAESTTNLVDPLVGILLHFILLGALITHAAAEPRLLAMRLMLSLALLPLIRIVSLGLPLWAFRPEWWYILTGIPLLVASIAVFRSIDLPYQQIGLSVPRLRHWPLTAGVALSGVIIGIVEFEILGSTIIGANLSSIEVLFFAIALIFGTGITEELIFRGLLQTSAVAVFGVGPGILFTSTLFSLMHMGHGSMVHVVFIFAIAVYFGYVRHWTGSLLGVIAAHSIANIAFFILLPS